MENNRIYYELKQHDQLSKADRASIKRLFDQEYQLLYGEWTSECPYGYAGHDIHVVARFQDMIIGHVGSSVRHITVGHQSIKIAGIGGVLVEPSFRGKKIAFQLLQLLTDYHVKNQLVDYSYLGCREEVIPFYQACGFSRIERAERYVNRQGEEVYDVTPIIMIKAGQKSIHTFPQGVVHLNGRAW